MSYPENCLVSIANAEQCSTAQVFPTTIRIANWDTIAPLLACVECDASGAPAWDGVLQATFGAPGDPPVYVATGISNNAQDIQVEVAAGPWSIVILCNGLVTADVIFYGVKGGDTPVGVYPATGGLTPCSVVPEISIEAVSDGPTEVTECIPAGANTAIVSGLTTDQKSFIQTWLDYQASLDAEYTARHAAAGYDQTGFPRGGVDVSVDDKPNDSSLGNWVPFGRLTIREDNVTDFNVPGGTIILTIPQNFIFKPGVGTISKTGTDITAISLAVAGNKLTITYTVADTASLDTIIIDGLFVQPNYGVIDFTGGAANLLRVSIDPGTAVVDNIDQDVTNFSSLNFIAGQAAKLRVFRQPAGATAGSPFATQPIIEVLDQYGNNIPADNTTVVSVARLHGTGVLSGTTDVTAVTGTATFTDLQLSESGLHDLRFFVRGLSGYIAGTLSADFTVT